MPNNWTLITYTFEVIIIIFSNCYDNCTTFTPKQNKKVLSLETLLLLEFNSMHAAVLRCGNLKFSSFMPLSALSLI